VSITIDPEMAWAEGLSLDQWFDHDERLAMADDLGMTRGDVPTQRAAATIAKMEAVVGGVGESGLKRLATGAVMQLGSFATPENPRPLGGHRIVAVIERPVHAKTGKPLELHHPDVIAALEASEEREIERRNRMAVASSTVRMPVPQQTTGKMPVPHQTKKAGSLWEHARGPVTVEVEA
jgi:hypothetical protein